MLQTHAIFFGKITFSNPIFALIIGNISCSSIFALCLGTPFLQKKISTIQTVTPLLTNKKNSYFCFRRLFLGGPIRCPSTAGGRLLKMDCLVFQHPIY
jgi:hypothetical protein